MSKPHQVQPMGRSADGSDVAMYFPTLANLVKCIVPAEGQTVKEMLLDELLAEYADEINGNTNALGDKVDKESGKGLSANDFTAALKKKLDEIADNANNYTHPVNHPPGIISQDEDNRFVTDAEKSAWNAKAGTSAATTEANGLMSSADKTKLDGIDTGAQKNTVTSVFGQTGDVTGSKSDVGLGNVDNTSDANKPVSTAQQNALNDKVDKVGGKQLSEKDFTATLLEKLNNIADNANDYEHPTTPGNKHIPSGGANGQILRYSADGTADWGADKANRAATTTVGLADAGFTAADVDILIPAGTANCLSYLNQALSAIPAAGGKIVLLNGTYNFGSPWVIERSNVTVEGMGISTKLVMNGAKTSTNDEANAKSNNAVIFLSGRDTIIRHIAVDDGGSGNALSYGIYINKQHNNIISNIDFSNLRYGIYINNGFKNTLVDNKYTPDSNGYGVYLDNSYDNYIASSKYDSGGSGVYLDNSYRNVILGNTLSTNVTKSINLVNNSRNNSIIGNRCGNSNSGGGGGIFLDNSSSNAITGNICGYGNNSAYNNTTYGIYITNSSDKNTITGNIISNGANTGTGRTYGIYLNGSNSNIITDNIICNTHAEQSATKVFALYIVSAGEYNQITNNNLSGVTQAAAPGSAYTTNGTTATAIPGSPTTVVSFGTGGIIGFNVV